MSVTNPQAFPCASVSGVYGMTLRDYFAAEIIRGMFGVDSYSRRLVTESCDSDAVRRMAEAAYRVADAMIAARGE